MPEAWETLPLKHLATFTNGFAFKPAEWGDEGTPIIRIENLNGGGDFNSTLRHLPDRYTAQSGDILFGWSGNRGTSFGPFVWSREGRHYVNQHIFKVGDYCCDRMWFYWTLRGVTWYVEGQAHGIIGMVHITRSKLGALAIPLPPLPEQRAIAAFLDRETARIDTLVLKKERLLRLLDEQRTALISQAVTKGLDPDVPMKDSGVEWLGEVPEGWEVVPVRRLLRPVRRPLVLDANEEYREIGIRSWGKGLFHKDPVRGSTLGDKRVFALEPGDLVFNIVFAWEGAVGRVTESEQGMIASHRFPTFRCRPQEVLLDYVLLFFQSDHGRAVMAFNSPGAAGRNKTLRVPAFLGEAIPLPPIEEQQIILARLREAEERGLELSKRIQRAIDLLKEYRTALISAAVTGKIDVRGEAPGHPA